MKILYTRLCKGAENMQTVKNFIVFEGIDGSGKSTQLRLLQEKLQNAWFTAEPTSVKIGAFLRNILRGEIEAHPTTVMHLFAADRAEHIYGKDGILERCESGEIVVCDRYLFSNLAYQGVTCGLDLPFKLNSDFPLPQIVFYFDIEPEQSLKRVRGRGESEIYEKQDFLQKTYDMYNAVFDKYEKLIATGEIDMNIVKIDATQDANAIAEKVFEKIRYTFGA